MRTIAALSFFFFVAGSVAVAAPPPKTNPISPSVPRVGPAPTLAPASITGARRTGSAAYVTGAITYEVDVVNPNASPLETNLVVDRLVPTRRAPEERGRIASVPVRVPAKGSATVSFTDAAGLVDGCTTSYDRLSLATGTSTRMLKITPKCAFGAKAVDPLASLAPDRRVQHSEGRVAYHTPKMVAHRVACGIAPLFSATVRNQAAARASGVHLLIVGPNGERSPSSPTTFDLAPGAERAHEVAGADFAGQVGRWTLRVGANGVPVAQPDWYVDVSRLCSLDVTLAATNDIPPLPGPAAQRGE